MGEGLRAFDCAGRSTREINVFLREASTLAPGAEVVLLNPDSRHNLAVGLTSPIAVRIEGHVGYYCAGLCEDVDISVAGDAGWGVAENLMSGRVVLSGSAGSSAGATMRGGMLVIHGNAGARCGAAMKGGTLVVAGDVGYMTGFMMQKGTLIIGGDAGEALGDSLYEGTIYLRGHAAALGSDAVISEVTDADISRLSAALSDAEVDMNPADFQKIVSGKKLYNFNTKEKEIWRTAL